MSALQHEALLYRDGSGYVRAVVDFVERGLAAGEPVLVAVPRPRLDLLGPALPAGVTVVDMAQEGRNPGRVLPGVLHPFADEHPDGRVRIVGESLWAGRSPAEYPACVQHEAMVNLVLGERAVSVLCPYDTDALGPRVIADAAATHPVLLDEHGSRSSHAYRAPETVVEAFNRPLPPPPASVQEVTFGPAELGGVRRFVSVLAAYAGLHRHRVDDLEIAVNELATNAVTHSSGPGRMRVWHEPDRVVCEVSSPGELVDRTAGRVPAPFDAERGRGLVLVNHLCDLVQIYTDRTETTVRLHVWL